MRFSASISTPRSNWKRFCRVHRRIKRFREFVFQLPESLVTGYSMILIYSKSFRAFRDDEKKTILQFPDK